MSRLSRIYEFLNQIESDPTLKGGTPSARLPRTNDLVKSRRVNEIRSKRHTADVIAIDVLGNFTVLYADGGFRQYVSIQELRKAGIQ